MLATKARQSYKYGEKRTWLSSCTGVPTNWCRGYSSRCLSVLDGGPAQLGQLGSGSEWDFPGSFFLACKLHMRKFGRICQTTSKPTCPYTAYHKNGFGARVGAARVPKPMPRPSTCAAWLELAELASRPPSQPFPLPREESSASRVFLPRSASFEESNLAKLVASTALCRVFYCLLPITASLFHVTLLECSRV